MHTTECCASRNNNYFLHYSPALLYGCIFNVSVERDRVNNVYFSMRLQLEVWSFELFTLGGMSLVLAEC